MLGKNILLNSFMKELRTLRYNIYVVVIFIYQGSRIFGRTILINIRKINTFQYKNGGHIYYNEILGINIL